MRTYTVAAGKQAARPLVSPFPRFGLRTGAWNVQLSDGWDYELPANASQWVKLCGDTFNPIDRDKNAVMLAARHFRGRLEVTPYLNIQGERLFPESPGAYRGEWPVVEVEAGRDIFFYYDVVAGKAHAHIDYEGEVYELEIPHPGACRVRFEVNFYFGGSEPAPKQVSIRKKRIG